MNSTFCRFRRCGPPCPSPARQRSGWPQPQEAPMPDHSFPVDVVGGVPVVAAPEEIDITNAEALRSALLQAAASGPGTLAVDMTRTQFCDSSGPHALLAAHNRAEAAGGEVLLVIPSA